MARDPHKQDQFQNRSSADRSVLPGELKKGTFERHLGERYGHPRESASCEPSGTPTEHGASNVGEDASSGSETIAPDPTHFADEKATQPVPPDIGEDAIKSPQGRQ